MIRDSANSDIAHMEFRPGSTLTFSATEDAHKYPNADINFGYQINGTPVQINRVPPLTNIADTFILFANAAQGSYQFQLSGISNIPAYKAVLLRDLFTSQVTDLRSTPVINFQITTNTASSGNRFQFIIIDQSALPVELISFTAKKVEQSDDITLRWITANEKNNAAFMVERSFDGDAFEEIGSLKGAGNSNTILSYSFLDESALKEANSKQANVLYYRLRQMDFSGEAQVSKVVSVSVHDAGSYYSNKDALSLYPNPFNNQIVIEGYTKQTSITITNVAGVVVYHIDELKASWISTEELPSGVYYLRAKNELGVQIIKVCKQ